MIYTYHYCVPTALSILTDIPVEEVERMLKQDYLGDVQISGIYIGLALKFLSDNGYHWNIGIKEGQPLKNIIREKEHKDPHLVEIPGHALILKDSKIYDNSYPQGISITSYERRAERIVRAYRIIK